MIAKHPLLWCVDGKAGGGVVRNSFELLTSESEFSTDDLRACVKRITRTYKLANDLLTGQPCPMTQVQLAAAFWDLVASGIDPCFENLSDATGTPASTVHRWMKARADAGIVTIVPDGRRRIFVVDRPARREMARVIDAITNDIKCGLKP